MRELKFNNEDLNTELDEMEIQVLIEELEEKLEFVGCLINFCHSDT